MYKFVLLASVALAVAAAPISTPAHPTSTSDAPTPSPTTGKGDKSDSEVSISASSGDGQFSGRGTWFTGASGSCAIPFDDNDLHVAMNAPQMGGTSQCGKSVKISYGGKTTTAKVLDTCPSCSSGSLDLSPAAFKALAPLDAGVISITWEFV
jgi:expansin (peptidoglycan-binding protein)